MKEHFWEINKCRICGNEKLEPILSLGEQYVIDFLDSVEDFSLKTPLDLELCNIADGGCGLLQLKHTVNPDLMYRKYWYKSGINESMVESLRDVATKSEKLAKLKSGDLVVDIGCNDGTMFELFNTPNLKFVGFEPARNLMDEAREKDAIIINDYFKAEPFCRQFGENQAKLITSIAMFYDLDNPNAFIKDIKKSLADDGVWTIQMAYLPDKLKTNAFDETSSEHLGYYTLNTLMNLMKRHNLEVFDFETNKVNGGSIRAYIKNKGAPLKGFEGSGSRLEDQLAMEDKLGLNDKRVYKEFASRVGSLKEKTVNFINNEVNSGKKVYVYGASTKGNTLLQYYGLDTKLITAAAERNPVKWGKLIVGSNIPIVSEAEARKNADYFLALPWHFIDGFLKREKDFLDNGGKFIVPLPDFKVISKYDL